MGSALRGHSSLPVAADGAGASVIGGATGLSVPDASPTLAAGGSATCLLVASPGLWSQGGHTFPVVAAALRARLPGGPLGSTSWKPVAFPSLVSESPGAIASALSRWKQSHVCPHSKAGDVAPTCWQSHCRKAGGVDNIVMTISRKYKPPHLMILTCLFVQIYHWSHFSKFQNEAQVLGVFIGLR